MKNIKFITNATASDFYQLRRYLFQRNPLRWIIYCSGIGLIALALLPTITENNVFVLDLITFIPMGLLFLFLPHTILKLISNYQYKKIKNYWPNQTTIADDGIEIKNNLFQAFYKWKSFTKYWDGNDCFYIFINPYQAIIIPKRDIHNKSDINAIANKFQKEI